MESVSGSHTILAINQKNPFTIDSRRSFHLHTIDSRRSFHVHTIDSRRSFHLQTSRFRFRFIFSYKKSDFQDFQGFAKPSRLLPSKEPKVCTEKLKEKIFPSTSLNIGRTFYKLRLQTSNMYGSSLSNINAGVLLCLIDEKGDSILQRIPAYLLSEYSMKSSVENETLHFQRGSVDEFVFEGPELGKVQALWIGIESGQWRLGGVSLVVLNKSQSSLEEDGESLENVGAKYDFEVDDILLGESSDESMLELRPHLVSKLSGPNIFSEPTSPMSDKICIEKSMKEYADLKFSLLLYDAILIVAGTSFASFSMGENSGFAFFLGGIIGFVYLLVLQRSVDGLPASELISKDEMVGFRGPISALAVAVAVSSLAIKYSMGEVAFALTPKEVLVGMMGFLACKVAVVLAAFKPLPVSIKEKK